MQVIENTLLGSYEKIVVEKQLYESHSDNCEAMI